MLFDAADTLFHPRGSVGEIYWSVAQTYGCRATAGEIQAAFRRQFKASGPLTTADERRWWRDVVFRVFTEVGMIERFDSFFDEVYARFADGNTWLLFPDTRATLEALARRDIPMGVISNFDSRLYGILERLGIDRFFQSVTISSESGAAKPDPRIFRRAAASLNMNPWQILVVGDSPDDDARGAERAGLIPVLLDRHGRYDALSGYTRIRSLEDVPALVGGAAN